MAYEEWGPLAGLIGTWESGYDGLDVSYHNEGGKIAETPYREHVTLKPFGPVDNGAQCLYGLDYRMAAYREYEDAPFHTEVGYWMWDAAESQVMRCFAIPRGQVLIAGGNAEATASSLRLESVFGSSVYGILSNPFLDRAARSTRFDVSITMGADTFSYEETTVIEHRRLSSVLVHTDRNTLRRISFEA